MIDETCTVHRDKKIMTPRKRRRRFWVVTIALAVLAAVAAAPYVLASGPGTRTAVAIINGRIAGSVAIDDLSMGWIGPTTAKGVRVWDSKGRQVLSAPEVRYAGGLLRAVASTMDFGQITLRRPEVTLYRDAGGGASIAHAFERREPSPSTPPRPKKARALPDPRGRVSIQDATVRIVDHDGRTLTAALTAGTLDINTLDEVSGKLALVLPGNAPARVSFTATRLLTDGQMSLANASAAFQCETGERTDFGSILGFATGTVGEGTGRLSIDGNLASGQLQATGQLRISGLSLQQRGLPPQPVDLAIDADVRAGPRKVAAALHLTGPGDLRVVAHYDPMSPSSRLDAQTVLCLLLRGQPATLPDFSLQAGGHIDASLLRAMAGAAHIRGDTEITGGRLTVDDVRVTSGASCLARGAIHAELAATRAGRPLQIDPVDLRFDASVGPDVGLKVATAQATAGFAEVTLAGTAGDAAGKFILHLSRLDETLHNLLDIELPRLGGELSGTLACTSPTSDRIEMVMQASLEGLRVNTAWRAIKSKHGQLSASGYANLDGRRVMELGLATSKLEIDNTVLVTQTGRYDPTSGSVCGELTVTGNLEGIGGKMSALAAATLRGCGAKLVLKARW